jgi:hypothetical protein
LAGAEKGRVVEGEPATPIFTVREIGRYFVLNKREIWRPMQLAETEVIGNIYGNLGLPQIGSE